MTTKVPTSKLTSKDKTLMNRFNRYNIYFTLERALILHERGASSNTGGEYHVKDDVTDVIELPPLPERYHHLQLPKNWYLPTKFKKGIKRRPHRKSHGVVSFGEMAKIVADNWKRIDRSILDYVNTVAKILKMHFEMGTFGEVGLGDEDKQAALSMLKESKPKSDVIETSPKRISEVEKEFFPMLKESKPKSDVIETSPKRVSEVEKAVFNGICLPTSEEPRASTSNNAISSLPAFSIRGTKNHNHKPLACSQQASPISIALALETRKLMLQQRIHRQAFSLLRRQESPTHPLVSRRQSVDSLSRNINASVHASEDHHVRRLSHDSARNFAMERTYFSYPDRQLSYDSARKFATETTYFSYSGSSTLPTKKAHMPTQTHHAVFVDEGLLPAFQSSPTQKQQSQSRKEVAELVTSGLVDIHDNTIHQMWHHAHA